MKRDEAIAYAYRLCGNRFVDGKQRKGERCAILGGEHGLSQVRFEDGSTAIVNRMLLRRLPESAIAGPKPD